MSCMGPALHKLYLAYMQRGIVSMEETYDACVKTVRACSMTMGEAQAVTANCHPRVIASSPTGH